MIGVTISEAAQHSQCRAASNHIPTARTVRHMAADDSRTILLLHDHELVVDASDYDRVVAFRWTTQQGKCGTRYAYRFDRSNGRKRKVYLHRWLLEAEPRSRVDHINGNGLDNRRANLRACSNTENMRNIRHGRGRSAYKGVAWSKRRNCWRAYIVVASKQLHLGYHADEAAAAAAYDDAAVKYFREFAKTNAEIMGGVVPVGG